MNLLTKQPLLLFIPALCVFVLVASYSRFIVTENYTVQYESVCEPETESCFARCIDDECSEMEFYALAIKNAYDVKAQCGTNVLECEAASECLSTDRLCEITYCSAETSEGGDSCDTIVLSDDSNAEPL